MKAANNRKIFLFLFAGVFVLLLIDIGLGSVKIPITEILSILFGDNSGSETTKSIILNFRLPRAIAAVFVGAGLGAAGLQMQTLFRNPLAGPFVLGISSGASLGVAIAILASGSFISFLSIALIQNWFLVLSAAAGSTIVFLLVIGISHKVRDSMALLIIGIMLASISGAIVGALQYFSSATEIQIFLIWTLGSLGGLTWGELTVMIPVLLIGLGLGAVLFKALNAMLLGDNYALTLGMNIKQARNLIILSTSLLAGSITAFCGPIAFIGLAVPHITRMTFNSGDHKVLYPAVVGVGALVMLVCDIISQLPGSETILPINIITSAVGAPIVIWIIMRKKSVKSTFSW